MRQRDNNISARTPQQTLLLAASFVPALLPNNKTGSEFCLPPLVCLVSCLLCPRILRRWPPGGVIARGRGAFQSLLDGQIPGIIGWYNAKPKGKSGLESRISRDFVIFLK